MYFCIFLTDTVMCCYILLTMSLRFMLEYRVEPLYKGHAGTTKSVLYTEVSFIQRLLNYTQKQVSFIERCPLLRVSFTDFDN